MTWLNWIKAKIKYLRLKKQMDKKIKQAKKNKHIYE
tara:strand:+ start:2335 stop:2442 length:108 start_codon:yes stop_codon:yes gene_type:complete